ncbi:MAG: DUF2608 domain-containing protein [Verrucomicrobia bacterium]|nr:DUF2608 domain-containing protein [Verrucomicrobiota bacterium]
MKKFAYLILCSIFFTEACLCDVKEIDSLKEIPAQAFNNKTLVLFDLDDVLIYPCDALLQNWRSEWKPEGVRAWTDEEDTLAWMSTQFQLMDPYGPVLLNTLNSSGIPTIGFTSFAVDKPEMVPSIPNWRSEHLNILGLDFPWQKEATFPCPAGYVPASFEKGVLYCGNLYKKDKDNKGKVLSLYLDWIDWTPDLVVLIDDGASNIESVQKELSKRDIPFLGFLYLPKALDPIDEKIAEIQHITLIEQNVWLSDDEAIKQMK